MIPTQDPTATATRWIRKASEAKKPLRVFLGVNNRGGDRRLLIATDDAGGLVKQGPRETLTVHPDASPTLLAAAMAAVWARLLLQVPAEYPRTQQQRFRGVGA